MKKLVFGLVIIGILALGVAACSADVRTSGPGPFGSNGGSQVQSPGNRPMPPVVNGPHDIWPPVGN